MGVRGGVDEGEGREGGGGSVESSWLCMRIFFPSLFNGDSKRGVVW